MFEKHKKVTKRLVINWTDGMYTTHILETQEVCKVSTGNRTAIFSPLYPKKKTKPANSIGTPYWYVRENRNNDPLVIAIKGWKFLC